MRNASVVQSELKSKSTAYLMWFVLGSHYAYLGKFGLQILFWMTAGGVGIWAFIDLFRMPQMVSDHNLPLYEELEDIAEAKQINLVKAMKQA